MTKTNGSNEMPWYVDPKEVSFFAISRFKIQAISNKNCMLTKICQNITYYKWNCNKKPWKLKVRINNII